MGRPSAAGGLVWSIGGNSLYGINPSTGATVEQLTVGSQANHFPTPSVGDGLLLAPASNQVVAFAGSAGSGATVTATAGATEFVVLARRLRRWDLHFRQCRLPRLDRRHAG